MGTGRIKYPPLNLNFFRLLLHNLLRQLLDLRLLPSFATGRNPANRRAFSAQGHPLPPNDPHTHTRKRMLPQIGEPHIQDLGISIPSFDEPLVRLPLEVLLALLMRERTPRDGPQASLRGEPHELRYGDT